MAENGTSPVLRRKVRPAVAGGGSGLKRAFRLALARAADDFSGLLAAATGLQEEAFDLDQALSRLESSPIIYALTGPNSAAGLVALDHGLQSAILEHVTTGRIAAGETTERRPTRTDAVLCGAFIDTVLRALVDELAGLAGAPDMAGFAFSHTFADTRAAEMALDNVPLHRFEVTLDLEGGTRQGKFGLYLPILRTGASGAARGGWDDLWAEQVDRAEVRVEAVLARLKWPLNEVVAFRPGQVLHLPMDRIEKVALIGADGTIVGRAKLGRTGDRRALRITSAGAGNGPVTGLNTGAEFGADVGAGPGRAQLQIAAQPDPDVADMPAPMAIAPLPMAMPGAGAPESLPDVGPTQVEIATD